MHPLARWPPCNAGAAPLGAANKGKNKVTKVTEAICWQGKCRLKHIDARCCIVRQPQCEGGAQPLGRCMSWMLKGSTAARVCRLHVNCMATSSVRYLLYYQPSALHLCIPK
jgi:hypothetical protein